jgi:hypothetical protein
MHVNKLKGLQKCLYAPHAFSYQLIALGYASQYFQTGDSESSYNVTTAQSNIDETSFKSQ